MIDLASAIIKLAAFGVFVYYMPYLLMFIAAWGLSQRLPDHGRRRARIDPNIKRRAEWWGRYRD